jgi:hypothetical protein
MIKVLVTTSIFRITWVMSRVSIFRSLPHPSPYEVAKKGGVSIPILHPRPLVR